MNLGVVHHLPAAGGAPRVLAEYLAHRPQHAVTVYTRMPEPAPGEALVRLRDGVVIRRFPLPQPSGPVRNLLALARLPRRGKELAAIIDAAGHDAVFAHASLLVQSHEVLPYLETPTLAYAPEPLRALHEDIPVVGAPPGLRERLARRGLDPYEALRKRLDLRQLPAADRVVTHSRFTARALKRIYGVDATVVPLGVNAADFAPSEPPPARRRSVLSVGALHPLKGHHFVVEALATIPAAQRPPLVVIGDRGALADRLRSLAAERGVDLELRQGIPFPDLVAEYHRAGVMACGQIREPFGLITLEAMAAGLPVVAVDEGGLAETVSRDRTGLLTPRDARAFGAALVRLLDDDGLAGRLARTGLDEIRREWTWERTAAGYDALLAELVKRR